MKKAKKILLVIGSILLALILIAGITVYALWHNEISSVASIKMLVDANKENESGPVYLMDVNGGYYFDDFIEQGGVTNDGDLIQFIFDNITKGILPISIEAPDIGCLSFTGVDENGDRYFGRNYDFSTSTGMIVRTNPGGGRYASISSVGKRNRRIGY